MDSTKISVPLKGLNTDLSNQNLSDDQYTYALNATYEDSSGQGFPTLQNDSSNLLTSIFNRGYKVIGRSYIIEQDRLILFLTNPTSGFSEVIEILNISSFYEDKADSVYVDFGDCEDCDHQRSIPLNTLSHSTTFHKIIESSCLGFNENHPITIRYKLTDCTLELYFVDGYNPDRYAYFDYVDDDTSAELVLQQKFYKIKEFDEENCDLPIYTNVVDCGKLLMQPNVLRPQIEVDSVIGGGQLKAGSYQFASAYATQTGQVLSSYFGITNIVPIYTRSSTVETDYVTDRAIKLSISNISNDTVYEYYNIAVAITLENFTTYKVIGTFPISQKQYIYTGNETDIQLTENDIFQKYPYYKHSKTITNSNNYLFRANLEEYSKLNLQPLAKYIKAFWQTTQMPEGAYRESKTTTNFRGYMRDEVYAFQLVFEYGNGEDAAAMHLVGREANSRDLEEIDPNDDDVQEKELCDNTLKNKRWEVYNTATIIESPKHPYDGCTFQPYEWGEFSYWESTDVYPNKPEIWGDLCGKPIRHFKFPDSTVTHIHDGINAMNGYGEQNMIYPIGIRIDHNSVVYALAKAVEDGIISQEDRDRIVSYRVTRANRVGNKSIVAKGLLFDVWFYRKKNQTYYYPNYPYNDLRPDPFLASNDFYKKLTTPKLQTFTNEGRYTFHSPDTSFVEPPVGTELKLETNEYGFSRGSFAEAEGQAKHKLLSKSIHQLALTFALIIADAAVDNKADGTVINATLTGLKMGSSIGAFLGPYGLIASAAGALGGLIVGLFKKNKQKGLKSLIASLSKMAYAMNTYQNLIDLFKSFVPYHNYTLQYNSVGMYNNYTPIVEGGSKIRKISQWNYIRPEINSVSEGERSVLINNFNRESSVYLQTNKTLPAPPIEDKSRILAEVAGCQLSTDVDSPISSYYASIKNPRLNQYGSVYGMNLIETNGRSYYLDEAQTVCVYGGDTFINRFALKRKHPFFIANTYLLPDDTDWYYSDYANVAYPTHYFNTLGNNDLYIGSFTQLYDMRTAFLRNRKFDLDVAGFIGNSRIPNSNLSCLYDGRFNFTDLTQITTKGYIYLYSYGIPYYLVESDINVDYRYAKEGNLYDDFYPRQKDLNWWLQEKRVPIGEDNTFYYNNTYSKQVKESFIGFNDAAFEPGRDCKVTFPNRVIYSEQSSNIDNSSYRDNWLVFKASNMWNAPLKNGRLISVEGIENDKVMVRFENATAVFNAYVTLPNSGDTIQIGTGGMFQSKPQEYAYTDLGYMGSQHSSILHTEYGHVMVDTKRGQIFNINGQNADEISKNGMKNWFKQNLPFKILKDFPEAKNNIDNAYKGLGITMSFDKRFNRFFLTKLDYQPKNGMVKYEVETNTYYVNNPNRTNIRIGDPKWFHNCSWTMSYNFHTQSWVSWHTFTPNYYVDCIDFFLSGINNNSGSDSPSSLWAHNKTNKSFQTYYGRLDPFVVEAVRKFSIEQNVLNSVSYSADVIKYHSYNDMFYTKNIVPFNRAVISNNHQSTGLIEFEQKNYYDLAKFLQYPKIELNKSIVEITNKENVWKFNNFYDFSKNHKNNIPLFHWNFANSYSKINYDSLNYNKADLDKNRMRGDWFKFRLINDDTAEYKIILKYLINKSDIS